MNEITVLVPINDLRITNLFVVSATVGVAAATAAVLGIANIYLIISLIAYVYIIFIIKE
jgi:hypothetical protein